MPASSPVSWATSSTSAGISRAAAPLTAITPLLPAGFQANGVGRGALCITCHNSRNGGSGTTAGLHEDGDPIFGTFTSYASPHEAAQGDVLMGRNAYFFGSGQIGQRSKHSLLADACVTCHLEKTPADPAAGVGLTTDGAGTNHSFGIVTDPTKTVAAQIKPSARVPRQFRGHGGPEDVHHRL